MKRKILLLFLMIIISSQAIATVVTQRKINPKNLENNLRTCRPYTETMQADYMGMNMAYKIQIEGWVNGKCRLNFSANVQNGSNSFKELYGIDIDDATVMSFSPKIRCEFTKQQLDYVGDSILQEAARNNGVTNNMLKNPNNIDISSINSSDAKLLDVVFGQNACTIVNSSDLENLMKELMQF